jgi:hypothetical protein
MNAMAVLVAATFIQLTTPDGNELDVNANEVSSVRAPVSSPGKWPKNTKCILFMNNGRFNAVEEECRVVREKLRGPCVLVCGGARG